MVVPMDIATGWKEIRKLSSLINTKGNARRERSLRRRLIITLALTLSLTYMNRLCTVKLGRPVRIGRSTVRLSNTLKHR